VPFLLETVGVLRNLERIFSLLPSVISDCFTFNNTKSVDSAHVSIEIPFVEPVSKLMKIINKLLVLKGF